MLFLVYIHFYEESVNFSLLSTLKLYFIVVYCIISNGIIRTRHLLQQDKKNRL